MVRGYHEESAVGRLRCGRRAEDQVEEAALRSSLKGSATPSC